MASTARRVWRFPNITLRLVLDSVQQGMNKVVFEVPPTLSKPDLKAFLESVYALDVAAINTMNYAGKRQRAAGGKVYTRADWKKAVVTLKNPVQLEQSALDKLESARQRS